MSREYPFVCLFTTLCLAGCDQLIQKPKDQPKAEQSSGPAEMQAKDEKRFFFPAKSGPFPESSVALDTITGQLCKTYAWQDNDHAPKGLTLCSELSGTSHNSFAGATKSYSGFVYSFDGTKWVKGGQSLRYNPKTQGEEPKSDDQYDPLNLLTNEEKAKRVLKRDQILNVAKTFGVTYEEASEEARRQGYQVLCGSTSPSEP
jgi:hypothetical protein